MTEEHDRARKRIEEIDKNLEYLRSQLIPPSDIPQDSGDAAEVIQANDEQRTLIEELETERDKLKAGLNR